MTLLLPLFPKQPGPTLSFRDRRIMPDTAQHRLVFLTRAHEHPDDPGIMVPDIVVKNRRGLPLKHFLYAVRGTTTHVAVYDATRRMFPCLFLLPETTNTKREIEAGRVLVADRPPQDWV